MRTEAKDGKFELMALPFEPDALAPAISAETLSFHHGKHLQTYVNNLNAALPGSEFEGLTLEEIVVKAEGGVLNNAGQILNHNLYFSQFKPYCEQNEPVGELATAINRDFGSFDAFKQQFQAGGATLFGSGWVWLAADADGKLHIVQEPNAGNPVRRGMKPILTFDVWEHAYYLDYQNRRPDHLAQLWNVLDWNVLNARYTSEA
jgi:Fe-Mn family superoxide dismutase